MRGYLLIHIGGYKMIYSAVHYAFSVDGVQFSLPDRMVPAERHPTDTPEWADEGWGVGDNPRERFCKWNGPRPKLKFHDFDAAVLYIDRLRQKRKAKKEAYTLVYVLQGLAGRPIFSAVSSTDEIAAFEAAIDQEIENNAIALAQQRAKFVDEYPQLDVLKTHFSGATAFQVSLFLVAIKRDGEKKALADLTVSKTTAYRWVRKLREIGLIT